MVFAPGTTTQLFNVTILQDAEPEPTETFTLTLSDPVNATLGDAVATGSIQDDDGSVSVDVGIPAVSYLGRGAPNPFAGEIMIRWGMATAGEVDLTVYDLQGRRIRRLVSGTVAPGHKDARWDGRDESGRVAPAGMYLVRMQTGTRVFTGRILRLR